MVEHWLPKPGVAGSSPVVRSRKSTGLAAQPFVPLAPSVPHMCPKRPARLQAFELHESEVLEGLAKLERVAERVRSSLQTLTDLG